MSVDVFVLYQRGSIDQLSDTADYLRASGWEQLPDPDRAAVGNALRHIEAAKIALGQVGR